MTDEGLVSLLRSDATLSGLVSNRIMPVLLDEGSALPALTFQVVGGRNDPTFEGSGMQWLRYQFDAHAKRKSEADAVRRALRDVLDGYTGTMTDGTYVQDCQFIQPIDYYDDGPLNFRCSSEFYFMFCLP
jgi:hypothetical protein